MKRFVSCCVVVLAVICMTGISGAEVPDLVGNWSGSYTGYGEDAGFVGEDSGSFFMNITEQKDRIFAGIILTKDEKGADIVKNISGTISADGTDLYLAEQKGGMSIGKVLGADEIELTYLTSAGSLFVAIDHFTRMT